jgi:hypothetical protein
MKPSICIFALPWSLSEGNVFSYIMAGGGICTRVNGCNDTVPPTPYESAAQMTILRARITHISAQQVVVIMPSAVNACCWA